MEHSRNLVLAVVITALPSLTACTPLRNPLMWNGALVSADVAGATPITGWATMAPGTNSRMTSVTVRLLNATPGDMHPWQVRQGKCGSDHGGFGSDQSYRALEINAAGRASGTATVGLEMPQDGDYYISVGASVADPDTIVACGNLDAPAR